MFSKASTRGDMSMLAAAVLPICIVTLFPCISTSVSTSVAYPHLDRVGQLRVGGIYTPSAAKITYGMHTDSNSYHSVAPQLKPHVPPPKEAADAQRYPVLHSGTHSLAVVVGDAHRGASHGKLGERLG